MQSPLYNGQRMRVHRSSRRVRRMSYALVGRRNSVRLGTVCLFCVATVTCSSASNPKDTKPLSRTPDTTTTVWMASRRFTVNAATFRGNDWWTIGTHPAAVPMHVDSSSPDLSICPITLDGAARGSREALGTGWPSETGFRSCLDLQPSVGTTLPPTDGSWHVAFAVRSAASQVVAALTVKYAAADAFVEVIPPPRTEATIVITPTSATVGAHAYRLPGYLPATNVRLALRQSGRVLVRATPCDFPSEIDCVGDVTSGRPVTVTLHQGDDRTALFIAWK
jgi:hypothetical protein